MWGTTGYRTSAVSESSHERPGLLKKMDDDERSLLDLPLDALLLVASRLHDASDMHALACCSFATANLCSLPELTASWVTGQACGRCGEAGRRDTCILLARALPCIPCSAPVVQQLMSRLSGSGLGPWASCNTCAQAVARWAVAWAVSAEGKRPAVQRTAVTWQGSAAPGSPCLPYSANEAAPPEGSEWRRKALDWALCLSDPAARDRAVKLHSPSHRLLSTGEGVSPRAALGCRATSSAASFRRPAAGYVAASVLPRVSAAAGCLGGAQ